MYTRESAFNYSCALIKSLVGECERTGLPRKKLCEVLNIRNEVLAMWLTGSRTCQAYWVVRNAEMLRDRLSKCADKCFINKRETI